MGTTTTTRDTYERESTSRVMRLDELALSGAAAGVSALLMLLLGVFGAIGVYEGAVEAMQQWHQFFEPTVVGTLAGMVEAAVVAFVFVYPLAWLYNGLAR